MLVSILIPMRNAQSYIKKTLNSILKDNYECIEIIVIDDGSTDKSLEVIKAFNDSRVKVFPGPCRGIAAAFNKALDLCSGELVMRCDADDLFVGNRVSWQVALLKKNPAYDGICCSFGIIDSSGNVINEALNSGLTSENIADELKGGITRTSFCTYCIKASVLKKLNGCREFFVTAEDIDLQLRIGEVANIWYEPRVGYLYRLHAKSITHTQHNSQRIFYEETAKTFQKQRLLNGIDSLAFGNPPVPPEYSDDKPNAAKKHIVDMLNGRAWELYRHGNKIQAIRFLFKALILSPLDLKIWKSILIIILK